MRPRVTWPLAGWLQPGASDPVSLWRRLQQASYYNLTPRSWVPPCARPEVERLHLTRWKKRPDRKEQLVSQSHRGSMNVDGLWKALQLCGAEHGDHGPYVVQSAFLLLVFRQDPKPCTGPSQ